ncbi:ABC transporter permease [Solicola gregarius]|uniref:Transport permease protein n=1 Tax=Solicola gregarius TaxID=2908642 RepID=A0AA46YLS4_9ACTN|nr:ABC transporter permease [Solicola gregarius]UYM06957.1 ABC transporter permease [Solicola gregarius]
MTPRITGAVALRVLTQLRRDHRTVAMLIVAPCMLMTLLWWLFLDQEQIFDQIGAPLLAVFPFIVMFLVTSVTTLGERKSGTLERLLAMPMGKVDFLVGYAIAFGVLAIVQSLFTATLALSFLGLDIEGSWLTLGLIAVLNSVVGTALGLFVSAFAETEFQAVQFMPLFVIPQILLCGLLVPTDQMPGFLEGASKILPLTYSVDAMQEVVSYQNWTTDLSADVVVVAAFAVAVLLLGAATLRRRSA